MVTFKEYLGLLHQPHKVCIIRHDVDHSLQHALHFATIEAHLGFRSTYFLLHSANYFDYSPLFAQRVKELAGLADIGFHNDAISTWLRGGKTEDLKTIVQRPVDFLRDLGVEVLGTASHGSSECYEYHFINYQLWRECQKEDRLQHPKFFLGDFGFEYEAYFLPRALYLSDSGGVWQGAKVHAFESELDRDFALEKEVDQFTQGAFQILIHPIWWTVIDDGRECRPGTH